MQQLALAAGVVRDLPAADLPTVLNGVIDPVIEPVIDEILRSGAAWRAREATMWIAGPRARAVDASVGRLRATSATAMEERALPAVGDERIPLRRRGRADCAMSRAARAHRPPGRWTLSDRGKSGRIHHFDLTHNSFYALLGSGTLTTPPTTSRAATLKSSTDSRCAPLFSRCATPDRP